jgi:hypothetical protein
VRLQITGQNVLKHDRKLGELVGPVKRSACRILDPERVKRHAVRHGHDLGVDDIGAADRERAGNTRKKAGVVCGVESDLGYRPVRFDPFLDRQRRAARLRLPHQAGVPRVRRRIE